MGKKMWISRNEKWKQTTNLKLKWINEFQVFHSFVGSLYLFIFSGLSVYNEKINEPKY